MPMTPGYYMPSLYYGQQSFTQPITNMPITQQSYSPPPQQTPPAQGMIWVDGEVGAKAYQMPQGWPSGTPIALWDTNDTVIYLKSNNQMGMPNPLQKIHYTLEENKNQSMLPAGNLSGSPDMQNYVTKSDFEQMKNELKEMLKQNQNGSQNQQNRGGMK